MGAQLPTELPARPSGVLSGPARGLGEGEHIMLMRRASARAWEGGRTAAGAAGWRPGAGRGSGEGRRCRSARALTRSHTRSHTSIPKGI